MKLITIIVSAHQWVNHQIEFVAHNFPHMHTNTIEHLWGNIKTDFRKKKYQKDQFISYCEILL